MLSHQYPNHSRALRALRSMKRFALCSVLMLGTTTLLANELSYNEFSVGLKGGGDFEGARDLAVSVEVGKKTFIELAGVSGNKDIAAVSVGGFKSSSPSTSAYGLIGVLFDTGGSGDAGLAASFGIRKLLSPHVEFSPSISVSSLVNQRDSYSYYYDEGNSTSAAIAVALRFYPVKYISIDLLGVASKEVSGTMLGISGHF